MKTSPRHVANALLRRLLEGERGDLPSNLGHLLDRASCMKESDRFYHSVLPPELADIRISPKTRREIIAALCEGLSRDPDEALIVSLSFSESDLSIRTVASVLVNPPRCLTMRERALGLGFLKAHLPACLADNSDFIPRAEIEGLMKLAKEVQNIVIDEGKTDGEKSERNIIKLFAEDLIAGLAHVGFSAT